MDALQASEESIKERATVKQQRFEKLFNVSLHIAVTGETRTERSTFINAIRGLDDHDEGAAETDVTETTDKPTSYKHPTIPNVVFWDLPGIGNTDVQFDNYDFFIIMSSERFRENDIMLAKEIKKRKKLFYFIRSKIDNNIRAEEHKEGFNKEETLSKIRRNCEKNLKEIENPKVFLISSKDVSAFDFEKLVVTLKSELPKLKSQALLQSVPVSSLAVLKEKVRMFKDAAFFAAFLCSEIAETQGSGLSPTYYAGILASFFTKCYHSFRLDDKSLEKLLEQVNKQHLVQAPEKRLATSEPDEERTTAEGIHFNFVYDLLRQGLKELEDTARRKLN